MAKPRTARKVCSGALILIGVAMPFALLYASLGDINSVVAPNEGFLQRPTIFRVSHELAKEKTDLKSILKKAAMVNNTVIITTVNDAWAATGSVLDHFLESFHKGERTNRLLEHLVIVALDNKAYKRCKVMHVHCYALKTEGVDFSTEKLFLTEDYLKMIWRRTDFLRTVLDLGYDFIFTDADVMLFRDPMPFFYPDCDFQIACDLFYGNPDDLTNFINGGFKYVKSNDRTKKFYKYWYDAREAHPGKHDQDVLNYIKGDQYLHEIGLT